MYNLRILSFNIYMHTHNAVGNQSVKYYIRKNSTTKLRNQSRPPRHILHGYSVIHWVCPHPFFVHSLPILSILVVSLSSEREPRYGFANKPLQSGLRVEGTERGKCLVAWTALAVRGGIVQPKLSLIRHACNGPNTPLNQGFDQLKPCIIESNVGSKRCSHFPAYAFGLRRPRETLAGVGRLPLAAARARPVVVGLVLDDLEMDHHLAVERHQLRWELHQTALSLLVLLFHVWKCR